MTEPSPKPEAKKNPVNRSLKRKQASRLAAVNALYAAHFNETAPTLNARVEHIMEQARKAQETGDKETALKEMPERAMLLTLLESYEQHLPYIDTLIQESLSEKWSVERSGPLLRSILHVATAELLARKDKAPSIIISEYVALTEAYFDDNEVSFVNGILATISKKIRDE